MGQTEEQSAVMRNSASGRAGRTTLNFGCYLQQNNFNRQQLWVDGMPISHLQSNTCPLAARSDDSFQNQKPIMTFTTSSDEIVRKKTAGVFLLFTVLPLFNLFHSSDKFIWYLGFFLFFMLILFYTYLHRPTQYQVDKDSIIIRRPIGNVEIKVSDINRVDRIHHDLLKTATKGGAFGYFGNFETDLGRIRFYATRRDRMVMLTKHDKTKIILTPDNQDEFIQSVETKASSQQVHLQ